MQKYSERLLTVAETAKRLGLKESTVRRRILERRFAYVKNGRAVRIPVEVVDECIANGWRDAVENNPNDSQ